jgi:hypothetical protein
MATMNPGPVDGRAAGRQGGRAILLPVCPQANHRLRGYNRRRRRSVVVVWAYTLYLVVAVVLSVLLVA